MSVPVGVEHSVGGLVKPGDRVDVITVDGGIPMFVVAGVEVIAVADPSAGGLGQSGGHHLVLSVDADQALQLAAAISAGSIEVVRSTGAAPPRGEGAGG
jgi:Flp pilus assembly protein CpaB